MQGVCREWRKSGCCSSSPCGAGSFVDWLEDRLSTRPLWFERSTRTVLRRGSRVVRISLRGSEWEARAGETPKAGGWGEIGLTDKSCKDGTFGGNQLDFDPETCDGWIDARARLAVLLHSPGGRMSAVAMAWLAAGVFACRSVQAPPPDRGVVETRDHRCCTSPVIFAARNSVPGRTIIS